MVIGSFLVFFTSLMLIALLDGVLREHVASVLQPTSNPKAKEEDAKDQQHDVQPHTAPRKGSSDNAHPQPPAPAGLDRQPVSPLVQPPSGIRNLNINLLTDMHATPQNPGNGYIVVPVGGVPPPPSDPIAFLEWFQKGVAFEKKMLEEQGFYGEVVMVALKTCKAEREEERESKEEEEEEGKMES